MSGMRMRVSLVALIVVLLLIGCEAVLNLEPELPAQDSGSPLFGIAPSGSAKFLGSILKGSGSGGMDSDSSFLTYWDALAPEVAGGWCRVEITRDTYTWKTLDEMYNFTRTQNIPFRGGSLLYGASLPDWLPGLSASAIRAEIEEYMIDLFARFPDMEIVQVVNEPINTPPPANVRNALGGDANYAWVRWIFTKAQQHAPSGTKLILNEYDVLKGTDLNAYENLIGFLVADGTIDGIGMQSHFLESTSASRILTSLDSLDDFGLPLYITEYEVARANDNDQLSIWQSQFPVFWDILRSTASSPGATRKA